MISQATLAVETKKTRLTFVIVGSTIVAALGGLLFGFDTAVISGTTRALTETFHLAPASLGWTVSIALWGTVIGAMLAGIPGARYGRRDSLRGLAVLYFVSALGCALAWDWNSLVLFRFVAGLAVGGSSVLGPMYIAEIAPSRWRGRLVGFFQFNIVFGILLAYLSNYIIGTLGFGASEWRWKLGIAVLPAALFFLALFGIPCSPRWLAKQNRLQEARAVLTATGEPDVEGEMKEIIESMRVHPGGAKERLFSWKYRTPIMLAVLVAFFNQMSGINAILYYLNDIFARAGLSKVSGDQQAVVIGLTNLVFTMLAMTIIDKVGRKTLLLIGSVGTAASLGMCSWIFQTGRHQHLLIVPLVGFVGFFALSQGAVIWVYISEVFPNRVRAGGQSLGSCTHWIMSAVLSAVFPVITASSGAGAPFAFFGCMMAAQFFVVLFLFPETKGISLEQMQKKLGIE
jgi:sugar porter (SP) family MFS transporter